MTRYIAQRLLAGLLTAFIVSLIHDFPSPYELLLDLVMNVPWRRRIAAPLRRESSQNQRDLGLDRPSAYTVLQMDGQAGSQENWGESFFSTERIWENFNTKLLATLQLVAMTQAIAVLMGIPAGIIMALKRNSWIDRLWTKRLQHFASPSHILDSYSTAGCGNPIPGLGPQDGIPRVSRQPNWKSGPVLGCIIRGHPCLSLRSPDDALFRSGRAASGLRPGYVCISSLCLPTYSAVHPCAGGHYLGTDLPSHRRWVLISGADFRPGRRGQYACRGFEPERLPCH